MDETVKNQKGGLFAKLFKRKPLVKVNQVSTEETAVEEIPLQEKPAAEVVSDTIAQPEEISTEHPSWVMTKEEALALLRKKIMSDLLSSKTAIYRLGATGPEVLIPKPQSYRFAVAFFEFDLRRMHLYANVLGHPNQFGAGCQEIISLTPQKFHEIAMASNFPEELQRMQTKKDWEALLDDTLKNRVNEIIADREKEEEQARRRYQVKLPQRLKDTVPKMELTSLEISLTQSFSTSEVAVVQKETRYYLTCLWNANRSSTARKHARELSQAEAAWLEEQVEAVVNNPDHSTWQSLAGGDRMRAAVRRTGAADDSVYGSPQHRYSDLKRALENLAEYGSYFEVL